MKLTLPIKFCEEKIDKIGNVSLEYEAIAIQIAIKIFKASDLTKTQKARIIVKRYVKPSDGLNISETIVDGYDDEALIVDYSVFKHNYRIDIIGEDIRVLMVVRWYDITS